MKQLLFILVFLAVIAPFVVDAHQIKTDHGVTVLLHVDPSDEPYSGTTTRMYLVFTNKDQINPDECNCVAYIAPNSELANIKEVGERFDFSTETERVMGSYSITYVFPRHNVYSLVLEGAPKEGASFEPFRIVYDLRVARGEEITVSGVKTESWRDRFMTYKYLLIGGLTTLVIVGIGVQQLYIRKRQKVGNLDSELS